MKEQTEIVVSAPEVEMIPLGTLETTGPLDMVRRATVVATELAYVVENCKLYTNIRNKRYVRVEGWTTLGAMLGVLPREVEDKTIRLKDGSWQAVVELVRVGDGAVIGRGSALCGMDEKTWASRAEYARRSMAITRAVGKAYRLGFSWIMSLAGYEPTPAEEMSIGNGAPTRKGKLFKETPRNSLPSAKLMSSYQNLVDKADVLGLKSVEVGKNATADDVRKLGIDLSAQIVAAEAVVEPSIGEIVDPAAKLAEGRDILRGSQGEDPTERKAEPQYQPSHEDLVGEWSALYNNGTALDLEFDMLPSEISDAELAARIEDMRSQIIEAEKQIDDVTEEPQPGLM